MCDGKIGIRGLEGCHRVEVVPRGHILKDAEIVLRDHPQGAHEGGGGDKAAIWLGSRLDVPEPDIGESTLEGCHHLPATAQLIVGCLFFS